MSFADERSGAGDTPISNRVIRYLFLDANRTAIAFALWLLAFGLIYGLGLAGIIGVSKSSPVSALLRAVVSGLFTMVTVVITINQLILSRVFGEPGDLLDRMNESIEFREDIADRTGVTELPTDPGAFLRIVAKAVRNRSEALTDAMSAETDEATVKDVERYVERVRPLVDHIVDELGDDPDTYAVLSTVLFHDFSETIAAGHDIQRKHREMLPEEANKALSDLVELFKSISVMRQYLKTLYIQQELSRVSRQVLYLGFPALVVLGIALLVYARASGTIVSGNRLLLLVTFAFSASLAPLAVLLSYVTRFATIARQSTSVGPFVPKEEAID
ncbi:hypothetical protein [Haloprofundus salilacus]|uniref:hypothetical protein n=1 Tax=Haloprofundus salilacus TaxID=2876190 RepID=UPI001CCE5402|nr:hypothetical protein [Haloprofundus salilacus]